MFEIFGINGCSFIVYFSFVYLGLFGKYEHCIYLVLNYLSYVGQQYSFLNICIFTIVY